MIHYFRVRYDKQGGHYHCRLFVATRPDGTYAKLGAICVGEEEWKEFVLSMPKWEFKHESER